MAGSEMPFEHLAAPAAFQAHDVIAMDGSPDRHGAGPLPVDFGCRFTEDRRARWTIEIRIGSWSAPIWLRRTYAATISVVSSVSNAVEDGSSEILILLSRSTKYHTRLIETASKASPCSFVAPPTSLGSLRPNSPRLSSVETIWEAESENL